MSEINEKNAVNKKMVTFGGASPLTSIGYHQGSFEASLPCFQFDNELDSLNIGKGEYTDYKINDVVTLDQGDQQIFIVHLKFESYGTVRERVNASGQSTKIENVQFEVIKLEFLDGKSNLIDSIQSHSSEQVKEHLERSAGYWQLLRSNETIEVLAPDE